MRKKIENMKEAITDALRFKDGITAHKQEKKPTGSVCDSISVKVITFERGSYDRNELESKSDIEKYMIAINDVEHCKIRESNEYAKEMNDFKPMEKFVFTYIVTIPTERLQCTQMSMVW
jgi:hypothetical protein